MCGKMWEGVGRCGEVWGVIRKTRLHVMRNRETCSRMPLNLVFNIILHGFCYHMVAYLDNNKCYRRS